MNEDFDFCEALRQQKLASLAEAKSQDLTLWRRWKASQSDADLSALIKQLNPVISREVNRWRNVAAIFVLENEAKALTIKALQSYDPNRGAGLATHVTAQLQKLSRTAYENQSTLSVPEAKRLSYNQLMRRRNELTDQIGHVPSLDELADHMRLPPARIQSLMNEVSKRELLESGEGPAFGQYMDDPSTMHLAWYDMTPMQRTIFEHRAGYNGAPRLSGAEIMKKTQLTQGQLSHQLHKITDVLTRAQKLR